MIFFVSVRKRGSSKARARERPTRNPSISPREKNQSISSLFISSLAVSHHLTPMATAREERRERKGSKDKNCSVCFSPSCTFPFRKKPSRRHHWTEEKYFDRRKKNKTHFFASLSSHPSFFFFGEGERGRGERFFSFFFRACFILFLCTFLCFVRSATL